MKQPSGDHARDETVSYWIGIVYCLWKALQKAAR